MSDNIPFEIQVEIMNRLPVKSLIQFRSVSKTWKSMIDSSGFIAEYSSQHTHMQHLLVRYDSLTDGRTKYVSIVDDDTFPTHRVSLPRLRMYEHYGIAGYSHGLFCLYLVGPDDDDDPSSETNKAVLWNPSIRKTIEVVVPSIADEETYETVFGFGVCRETNDPKIVKITHVFSWSDVESASCIPWQVEVFTLSTGTWRLLDGNLPRKLVRFDFDQTDDYSIVIDGVIYWLAIDMVTSCYLIISFDITSEGFEEVNLPNGFAHAPVGHCFSLFKLRESLVVLDEVHEADRMAYDVWLMEGGVTKSFTKLSTFNLNTDMLDSAHPMGFRKSGEHIIEFVEGNHGRLVVYDPNLKRTDNLGIDGLLYTFFVHPYMETLFLLDQPSRTVHS